MDDYESRLELTQTEYIELKRKAGAWECSRGGGSGMNKIPEELKPTCSCGEKMIVVNYKGYYDEFNYFGCTNCKLDVDDYEPEGDWSGSCA